MSSLYSPLKYVSIFDLTLNDKVGIVKCNDLSKTHTIYIYYFISNYIDVVYGIPNDSLN